MGVVVVNGGRAGDFALALSWGDSAGGDAVIVAILIWLLQNDSPNM